MCTARSCWWTAGGWGGESKVPGPKSKVFLCQSTKTKCMWLELLPVGMSSFPHLIEDGLSAGLDLRHDSTQEGERDLRKAFYTILKQTKPDNHEWVFQFYGTLRNNQNLSLLKFISEHEFEFAFCISDACKETLGEPMPITAISFFCSLELLEKFMEGGSPGFGWDFQLGGWLAKTEDVSLILKELTLRDQFRLFPAKGSLGFCSSRDWDCIQFFSTDEYCLKDIQKRWTSSQTKDAATSGGK